MIDTKIAGGLINVNPLEKINICFWLIFTSAGRELSLNRTLTKESWVYIMTIKRGKTPETGGFDRGVRTPNRRG
jgi:hypothetical protein